MKFTCLISNDFNKLAFLEIYQLNNSLIQDLCCSGKTALYTRKKNQIQPARDLNIM